MHGLPFASIADLLDILPDAVLMVDAGGRVVYGNPAVRGLLGYAPEELADLPLSALLPPAMRERHEQMVARFREHGQSRMMGTRPVLSALHRSGRVVPVSISICNLQLADGQRVSVAVVHDVSSLNTHLDRATEQAETDVLTGVGNRLRLTRRLQGLLATERPFAVLHLGLRRFRPLDDRHGHEAGDEALRTVGRRLRAQVRGADLVACTGSDEFVVLVDGLGNEQRLAALARSIRHSLMQPMRVETTRGAFDVDIGGAMRPRHGNTEAELLAAAARAMAQARQADEGYRLAADS